MVCHGKMNAILAIKTNFQTSEIISHFAADTNLDGRKSNIFKKISKAHISILRGILSQSCELKTYIDIVLLVFIKLINRVFVHIRRRDIVLYSLPSTFTFYQLSACHSSLIVSHVALFNEIILFRIISKYRSFGALNRGGSQYVIT